MNRKVKSFKQTVFLSEQCAMPKSYNKCSKSSLSTSTQAHNCFPTLIALSITRCSKSAQKFAVWVRQVTTVAVATTQLVLNHFKIFYHIN